jgi:prepilin-type N-terminal cleavage/methylation domain-containing protein
MESFSFLISSLSARRKSERAQRAPAARAFTIIEMIVVIAIIGIIMSVVIAGQSTFSRTLLLTDTAYTVALSFREAQTYGISSHVFATTNTQNTAYGLYFTPNSTNYTEFADIYPAAPAQPQTSYCPGHAETDGTKPDARPGNCLYDSGNGELVRLFTFGQGYSIGSITGLLPSGTTAGTITALDVTFQRPNTTAVLVGIIGGVATSLGEVHIRIQAPQNNTQCVVVTQLGEISVQETCTP